MWERVERKQVLDERWKERKEGTCGLDVAK
jgi:hypothetical protein